MTWISNIACRRYILKFSKENYC